MGAHELFALLAATVGGPGGVPGRQLARVVGATMAAFDADGDGRLSVRARAHLARPRRRARSLRPSLAAGCTHTPCPPHTLR